MLREEPVGCEALLDHGVEYQRKGGYVAGKSLKFFIGSRCCSTSP